MQVAIDGCKRLYAVDVNDEIKRIRSMKCMSKDKDFPKFMKYTHKIPVTKNGKDRPYEEIKNDRNRVAKRIDDDIVCPMNWMQERLEKIQGASTSDGTDILSLMAEKSKKAPTFNQMNKIRKIIEDYDSFTKHIIATNDFDDEDDLEILKTLEDKSEEVYQIVSKMKISFPTMYRMIEASFGYEGNTRNDRKYKNITKYTVKTMNVLYRANKDLFLSCFTSKKD